MPVFRKVRQEDYKYEASLSNTSRACLVKMVKK